MNVRRILKMIVKKERDIDIWLHNLDKIDQKLDQILGGGTGKTTQSQSPQSSKSQGLSIRDHPRLRETLPFLRRLASLISTFLEENRIFKLRNAFLFKGKSYLDQIYQEIQVLDQYLRTGVVPDDAWALSQPAPPKET